MAFPLSTRSCLGPLCSEQLFSVQSVTLTAELSTLPYHPTSIPSEAMVLCEKVPDSLCP